MVAGVAPTLRNPNRQYTAIATDPWLRDRAQLQPLRSPDRRRLPAAVLSGSRRRSPDDRLESRSRAGHATTAWRYWDWNPSNDRDFLRLSVTTISAAPSKQRQWTQEAPLRRFSVAAPRSRRRCLRLPADDRLRTVVHTGAGLGRRPLSARADALRGDARLARRLRLRPVCGLRECQRRALRTAHVVGDHRLRLLPGLRLNYDRKDVACRPASVRRPADDRPRARRPAALDVRSAVLHRGRR